ncbi:MAG: GNAT family N-acetyltransferase [Prochloraceae cyanobacterium]|nr:GNAT family N-acetyltransferase [Prochloraceae cyanobacterium]
MMKHSEVSIRLLGENDWMVLENVEADVFDYPVQADLAKEFLRDPRHHMVVAIDNNKVVGFASGVHYVHPDKIAELFINEVGVAPTYQRQGIAKKMLKALLARGKTLGCQEAWVATEPDNHAARALYTSVGGREDSNPFVLYLFSLEGELRS